MTARVSIIAVLCLCGGLGCAAFSSLDAENAVRRTLVARGIRQGFDSETGAYTVIASAVKRGVGPESPMFCAQQSVCFRQAELKAIHQILNMRAQTMEGGTSVRRDPSEKSARTFVETLSQNDMDGCLLVAFDGRVDGDGCVAAVAMSWSEDLERRARASAACRLRPADSWVDELKARLDGLGGSQLPPTLSFVDSAGFFHYVGVGSASFDDGSDLRRNAAVREADLMARKNLQLALYGRAAMRKKAELMTARARVDGAENLSAAYEALGEVSATTPLPQGSRPLFDKVVPAGNGSKAFVVVYGVVPPKTADGNLPSAGTAPKDVLIWNPRTGKFEKQ